jgi:hypothetical protein
MTDTDENYYDIAIERALKAKADGAALYVASDVPDTNMYGQTCVATNTEFLANMICGLMIKNKSLSLLVAMAMCESVKEKEETPDVKH